MNKCMFRVDVLFCTNVCANFPLTMQKSFLNQMHRTEIAPAAIAPMCLNMCKCTQVRHSSFSLLFVYENVSVLINTSSFTLNSKTLLYRYIFFSTCFLILTHRKVQNKFNLDKWACASGRAKHIYTPFDIFVCMYMGIYMGELFCWQFLLIRHVYVYYELIECNKSICK